jgi:diacylglycerol kinase family enzyme
MRLCRFDRNRLGLVEGGSVYDVTEATREIPPPAWPYPLGDPLVLHLDRVVAAAAQLRKTASRKALSDGKLGVYIAKPHSGLGLMWVLARAALGLWRGDDRLEQLSASEVTIMTRRRKTLRLSNDGEVVRMRTPLKYRVRPEALTVLVPHSKDAR